MAKYGPEEFKLKNGQTVTIRHCSPDDVDLFPEFQQQVARETTNTLQVEGKTPPPEKVKENWAMSESDEKHLRLGVFDKSKLIGQLGLRPIHADHPWVNHVGGFGMMVLEKYWGQGIGKRLLKIMDEQANVCGYTRLEAMVRTENERGIKLYVNSGYTLEGTRYNAALIGGRYQNEYYLGKILTEKPKSDEWTPPQLETKRLILRPLVQSDAENIFEYAKNPNVSLFTLWEPHKTVTDSLNFIVDYAHSLYREKVPEPFAITLRENPNKVIGTVGCFWVSKSSKSMELAYAVAESYWGKGLVTEASEAVVDYCFKTFEINRMQARCKTENKASARVMEKIGMTFEGTLKSAIFHRNRFWDMHYYSVLKDDWNKQQRGNI